jgi:hypothetical protein
MKRVVFGLLSALALTACNEATAPVANTAPAAAPAAAAPPSFELSCAAFADVTAANLGQRYGEANVSVQTLPGPEGSEPYQATVLFADDPARSIEIVWDDGTDHPSTVTVHGDAGQWRGPAGLMLGATVAQVEQANGGAFTMSGFDWDYGGYVTDWKNGALSREPCHVAIGFTPHGQNYTAVGDSDFASSSAAVRSASPTVAQIGLSFPNE